MAFGLIMLTALAATSAMTLWSHIVGRLMDQQYTEPQILEEVFRETWGDQSTLLSWSIHYALGLVMTIWLWLMYFYSGMENDYLVGGWFGLLAGAVGVVGWMVIFLVKSRPEETGLPGFYLQLLGGHALFGILAYLMFHYWG